MEPQSGDIECSEMDVKNIRQWEQALDSSELSLITANLPQNAVPGEPFIEVGNDGVAREWLLVDIVSGSTGSRWAYWAPWKIDGRYGVGPHPESKAIADGIFNGDAGHFIGMLGIPYVKIPGPPRRAWVLVSPRLPAPPEIRVIEEKSKERYEKSREIYNVDDGSITKL